MATPTVSLLLGVHNHQPVDNWAYVLDEATEKCYRPFLKLLEKHPGVRMSMHYSGFLLNWLQEKQPKLIDLIAKMVERNQVELFTGGMYEPILPIIPDEDKLGQIERLTGRIKELFGVTPKGLWLAERVWEPHLVKFLAEAGIKYICLDDSHFNSVGLNDEELLGRYISEEQGYTVDIFPVSKNMRYLIPYVHPEKIMEYLHSIATPYGNRAAIYFDDGEKFGVWPGTYKAVFEEKWLERFFNAIEENHETVKCQLYSEYVEQAPPLGRIYLPTASYSEMLEWALPSRHINALEDALKNAPKEYKRFLRGGFWRHFLVKYPESNNLHKKMLHVSAKVRKLNQSKVVKQTSPSPASVRLDAKSVSSTAAPSPSEGRGDITFEQKQAALEHLWQGQSNDAFWHGVFGGLYLTSLRTSTYKHLLTAERIADEALLGKSFLNIQKVDFDSDGQPEILVETHLQNLYLDPSEGGAMFELDYRPKAFNLLDTLSRRYEAYHDKLAKAVTDGEDDDDGTVKTIHERVVTKEKNLDKLLHYDWHRRMSLLDHFLAEDTTLEKLYEVKYAEQGDFINQPYRVIKAEGNKVVLERTGRVWEGEKEHTIQVEKQLTFSKDSTEIQIRYRLTNKGNEVAKIWFAPEFNVNFLAPDAHDRYYRIMKAPDKDNCCCCSSSSPNSSSSKGTLAVADKTETLTDKRMISRGVLESIAGIELVDEWLGIIYQLAFDRPTEFWRFPIETVSQSEAGFERVYQSSVLVPNWKLTLSPAETEEIVITQAIVEKL